MIWVDGVNITKHSTKKQKQKRLDGNEHLIVDANPVSSS